MTSTGSYNGSYSLIVCLCNVLHQWTLPIGLLSSEHLLKQAWYYIELVSGYVHKICKNTSNSLPIG